jgi:hypothetical protein
MMKTTRKNLFEFHQGSKMGMEIRYFQWLYEIAFAPGEKSEEFRKKVGLPRLGSWRLLANKLYGRTFRWSVPNDDNRAQDGLQLRADFILYYTGKSLSLSEMPTDDPLVSTPASIFEVLLGIARRMDELIVPPYEQGEVAKFFWELCENLDLIRYEDQVYPANYDHIIDQRLDDWMDRQYDYRGGIFPLRTLPDGPHEKKELWFQMMDYVTEKYDL